MSGKLRLSLVGLELHWWALADRCRYCAYFLVGSVIGVLALLMQAAMESFFVRGSPVAYGASVGVVNALGVISAFFAHRRFTFRDSQGQRGNGGSLWRFLVISVLGVACTSVMAVLFRFGLDLDKRIGGFAASVAFAAAVTISSAVTYGLNSRWTFAGPTDTNVRGGGG